MATKTFIPSPNQAGVFNFVKGGTGNALIAAVAGSGKSTTLIKAMEIIPITKSIRFFAFGRDIVADLKTKIPNTSNISISTIHSFGMGL